MRLFQNLAIDKNQQLINSASVTARSISRVVKPKGEGKNNHPILLVFLPVFSRVATVTKHMGGKCRLKQELVATVAGYGTRIQ